MTRPRRSDPDDELLRAAARRMAWQIALAGAVVVLLAALGTLALGPVLRHAGGPHPQGHDHDDALLRTTLLVAGGIGIVIAGVVGFLVARRAVAPLGAALALQRRFVADAGHELRTPLTALHTRAQLIVRRMAAEDPARPATEQLLADARILGEIVDELLASAQLAGDPRQGDLFDVARLADAVVAEMAVLAEQSGVRLTRSGAGTAAMVLGSRTALRRAITALVDNALGHTQPDDTIDVGITIGTQHIGIAVTDNGEGLGGQQPAELVRRFARGAQLAQRSDSDPRFGTAGRRFGLGLSLVHEIAQAHGGAFALSERPGGGAIARLTVLKAVTDGSAADRSDANAGDADDGPLSA